MENILKKIQQGKVAVIPCTGLSPVWKQFVKLRDVVTRLPVEYVQCRKCEILVSFASHSGTSNLLKHNCKKPIEDNFKNLPDEKVRHVKKFLMSMVVTSSATDLAPTKLFCGSGFLRMAQGLVSLGEKYGNIDVKAVHPSLNAINRQIVQVKEESRQSLFEIFKQAFDRSYCSFSLEICNSNGIVQKPLLGIFSMHYFKSDLSALRKRNLFAIGIDLEDDPTTNLKSIVRSFNIFGGSESQLQKMKIVSPNDMATVLMPFEIQDCVLNKINIILNAAINNSGNKTNDCNEIIRNCQKSFATLRTVENFAI